MSPFPLSLPNSHQYSYLDFKNASDVNDTNITENEFAERGRTYVVGNINKFKFEPEMTYIDMTTYEVGQIENPVIISYCKECKH